MTQSFTLITELGQSFILELYPNGGLGISIQKETSLQRLGRIQGYTEVEEFKVVVLQGSFMGDVNRITHQFTNDELIFDRHLIRWEIMNLDLEIERIELDFRKGHTIGPPSEDNMSTPH